MSVNQQKSSKKTKSPKPEFTIKPLNENQKFPFSCQPGISCFNRCCHEIDVILTPFDIIRIKNRLGLSSRDFLSQYCQFQKLHESEVPLVKIKSLADNNGACVFMKDEGCRIYDDRPLVCRTYPVGISAMSQGKSLDTSPYFLVVEDMCKGHFESKNWTLDEWMADQKTNKLTKLSDPWLSLVARLRTYKLMDDKDQKFHLFMMACYDIDMFRSFVFGSHFLKLFGIKEKESDIWEEDDEKLLAFGFKWLLYALFEEGPYKPVEG